MIFEATKKVLKTGKKTSWISLDYDWGIKPGDWVKITVERIPVPEEMNDAGVCNQE